MEQNYFENRQGDFLQERKEKIETKLNQLRKRYQVLKESEHRLQIRQVELIERQLAFIDSQIRILESNTNNEAKMWVVS